MRIRETRLEFDWNSRLGRLIDAAKAAAREAAAANSPDSASAQKADESPVSSVRGEGWASLTEDGEVYAGVTPAGKVIAVAFAVAGQSSDTLLPEGSWPLAVRDLHADTPVAVKYLGRWVVVTLADLASLSHVASSVVLAPVEDCPL